MMQYVPVQTLPVPSGARYSLVEVTSESLQFPAALQVFPCADAAEADQVLKSALWKVVDSGAEFVDVYLASRQETRCGVSVSFVWTLNSELRELEASDSQRKRHSEELQWLVKSYKPTCDPTPLLQSIFAQARLIHPHISRIRSLSFSYSGQATYRLQAETEVSASTLEADARHRDKRYRETEVMRILADVCEGLAYAKSLGVAHNNLKLSSIQRDSSGKYKLTDFRAGWRLRRRDFASPDREKTRIEVDPFAADVYSLGVCIAAVCSCAVTLQGLKTFRANLKRSIGEIRYAKRVKALLSAMVHREPKNRPSVESVLAQARLYMADSDVIGADFALENLRFYESLAASDSRNFCEVAESLHSQWEVLVTTRKSDAVTAGLELGEIYCLNLSEYAKARCVFTRTLAVASELRLKPAVVSLRVWLVGVSYYSGDYADAESGSAALLSSVPAELLSAEVYWTLGLYLILAIEGQFNDPSACFSALRQRRFSQKSPKSRILRSYLSSHICHSYCDYTRQERIRRKVSALCLNHCPTFILAGANLDEWADSVKGEEVALLRRTANCFFQRLYPNSLFALHSYSPCRGLLTEEIDTEVQISHAKMVVSRFYADKITAVSYLSLWAKRNQWKGDWKSAWTQHASAHFLNEQRFSANPIAAMNLKSWSELCDRWGNYAQGLAIYLRAVQMLLRLQWGHANVEKIRNYFQ